MTIALSTLAAALLLYVFMHITIVRSLPAASFELHTFLLPDFEAIDVLKRRLRERPSTRIKKLRDSLLWNLYGLVRGWNREKRENVLFHTLICILDKSGLVDRVYVHFTEKNGVIDGSYLSGLSAEDIKRYQEERDRKVEALRKSSYKSINPTSVLSFLWKSYSSHAVMVHCVKKLPAKGSLKIKNMWFLKNPENLKDL